MPLDIQYSPREPFNLGTRVAVVGLFGAFTQHILRKIMLNKNLLLNHFKTGFFGTIAAITLGTLIGNTASADQFIGHQNGREVVVHSNPFPVLLHRLVPPNYGRHVTTREYQASRRITQSTVMTRPNRNSTHGQIRSTK